MQILDLVQGSDEWRAVRAQHFTASEAPAMMGLSKYMTRTELLKQKATGIIPEVDAAKQRLFDRGHEAEAADRILAEEDIGEDLYPATATETVHGLPLLASYDGITMGEDLSYECKLWNETLAAYVQEHQDVPDTHWPQLEHQCLVSKAETVLFSVSDGTREKRVTLLYKSDADRRARVLAGWKQFKEDLINYTPAEAPAPEVTGQAPEALPALRIEVTGMVTASNLEAFKERALAVIGAVKTELATDQDFADAEKSVKWCGEVEERLEAAKQHALSQTESIDVLFKAIDGIKEQARTVRLKLEKLVKVEKERRKEELVAKFRKELNDHYDALRARTGFDCLAQCNFIEGIKGLKTLASMRDKLSVMLANAKVEASQVADRIQANVDLLTDAEGTSWRFLFPDLAHVVAKPLEDFDALLSKRIADHKAAEEKRLEAERERIRQEEQARIAREQAAADRAAQAQAAQAIEAAKAEPAPAVVKGSLTTEQETIKESLTVAPLPQADTGATLKLGEIGQRLGFAVTADFLESLGFKPVKVDKNAKLYSAATFPAICAALVAHIQAVAAEPLKLAA